MSQQQRRSHGNKTNFECQKERMRVSIPMLTMQTANKYTHTHNSRTCLTLDPALSVKDTAFDLFMRTQTQTPIQTYCVGGIRTTTSAFALASSSILLSSFAFNEWVILFAIRLVVVAVVVVVVVFVS